MPAHLRPIDPPRCEFGDCREPARYELRNTFNVHLGNYCGRHSNARLAAQLAYEKSGVFTRTSQ